MARSCSIPAPIVVVTDVADDTAIQTASTTPSPSPSPRSSLPTPPPPAPCMPAHAMYTHAISAEAISAHVISALAINDDAIFPQVAVDPVSKTLAWPNGIDLDPDVLSGKHEPANGQGPTVLADYGLETST